MHFDIFSIFLASVVFVFTQLFNLVVLNCSNENGLLMNRVFLFFALLTFISSCRMVPEGDAAAKRETPDGVPIVAVLQYVVSVSWTFSEFTNLSHFMV